MADPTGQEIIDAFGADPGNLTPGNSYPPTLTHVEVKVKVTDEDGKDIPLVSGVLLNDLSASAQAEIVAAFNLVWP